MKNLDYPKAHKKLSKEKSAEWKRVVFATLWKLWLITLFAELFLFIFFKPVPECDRKLYFELFVLRPTIWTTSLLVIAQVILNTLLTKVGREFLSVSTIIIITLQSAIVVWVHTSVPLLPVVLLFPLVLVPLYRDRRMGIVQIICSILAYVAYSVYFLPNTPYMPPRNSLIDVTIFVGCAISLFIWIDQVNVSFVLYEEKSERDSLTHLHNHESFYEELEYYMRAYKKTGNTFSVLIADIDDFKKVNDIYGHAFGDQVIQQIAATMEALRSKNDFTARYGGEEFVMLMPNKGIKEAAEVGEALRREFAQHAFLTNEGRRNFTISVGVAEYTKEYKTSSAFFACADSALYTAKNNGKNRVCCDKADGK